MRVLVVEDDSLMRRTVRRGLEEGGWAVDVASDGPGRLQTARRGCHDVIVLDLLLPGLGGIDVCRALRSEGVATPILMLTARSAVPDRVAGLDAGADDYLVKPFAFAELRARLRALARRPETPPEEVLRAGDLELDCTRHEARRAGRRLPLSSTELALLEYLLRRGRPCSVQSILDNVWGFRTPSEPNLVAVHVRHLRAKLEADGGPRLIETVRGLGYVVRAP
jgi:two-component system response regulator MprA